MNQEIQKSESRELLPFKIQGQDIPKAAIVNWEQSKAHLIREPMAGYFAKYETVKPNLNLMADGGDRYKIAGEQWGLSGRFWSDVRRAAGILEVGSEVREVMIAGEAHLSVSVVCQLPRLGEFPATAKATKLAPLEAFIHSKRSKRERESGEGISSKELARITGIIVTDLETKALNKVTRKLTGLPSSFTQEEISGRVFLFRRDALDPSYDGNAEIIRREALSAGSALFSGAQRRQMAEALPEDVEIIEASTEEAQTPQTSTKAIDKNQDEDSSALPWE